MTIEQIKSLKENASKGEWKARNNPERCDNVFDILGDGCYVISTGCCCGTLNKDDAMYIASLPSISSLAISQDEEITKLKGLIQSLQSQIAAHEVVCTYGEAMKKLAEE